jgi:hypothetical protein
MKEERSCLTDQKRRTLAEGKSVVISKLKNSTHRILKFEFLCQK